MYWKECKTLIQQDFNRKMIGGGQSSLKVLLFRLISNDSFQITFWFRIGSYLKTQKNIFAKFVALIVYLIYKHKQHKTGIQLPLLTKIEGGLQFFHYNCIVIAQSVVIGKNASIHQGVTIGRVFSGPKAGVPTIGDNVVIFAGAKILVFCNI